MMTVILLDSDDETGVVGSTPFVTTLEDVILKLPILAPEVAAEDNFVLAATVEAWVALGLVPWPKTVTDPS